MAILLKTTKSSDFAARIDWSKITKVDEQMHKDRRFWGWSVDGGRDTTTQTGKVGLRHIEGFGTPVTIKHLSNPIGFGNSIVPYKAKFAMKGIV